jgi:hypothetical protein
MKTIKNYQFKRMLVLSGMAFFSFMLFAEGSGVIKGRVIDENNQPVEYATTVLKNANTNKFVTGAVCNYKGEYIIENVEPGEYELSTKMIGYEKTETQKVVVNKDKCRVVEKDVVMIEKPDKSIVVTARKATTENNKQTAER